MNLGTPLRNPFLGPCHCDLEAAAGRETGSCGSKDYVSSEELAALAQMRQLQATAASLRAQLRELPAADPRHLELSRLIEHARGQFQRCRAAWTEANELKLRRLEHRP
jgi:hypothetical protein